MPGPFNSRDYELGVQLEVTYNLSPGAPVGADIIKSQTEFPFKKTVARYNRDRDRDRGQRSITSTQKGRESGSFEIKGDVIPAGAGVPTKPDMDLLFEAHFGQQHLCTAHTTTAAGSAGTDIVLTGGGVAASGIQAGDLVMIDQDGAGNYEVRQVLTTGVGGADHIAVDRAFTTVNVAAGRAVKTGWTVRLSSAAFKSLSISQWLDGDNFRHVLGGAISQKMELQADYSQDVPVVGVTFTGPGARVIPHANARPSPVTVGQPLVPTQGKVFIGASGVLDIVKASVSSHNGLELRATESGSLFPTGVKGTANGGRYAIDAVLDLILRSGLVEGYFDNAQALTAYDVIVQHGILPGATFAYRMAKFIPNGDMGVIEGEPNVNLSGKCYGGGGFGGVDDELVAAFL